MFDVSSVTWLSDTVFDNSVTRTVRAQVHVTDNLSGVGSIGVGLSGPNGGAVSLHSSRLLSGTTRDGVWELTGTVNAYSQVGEYRFTALVAQDLVTSANRTSAQVDIPAFTLTSVGLGGGS